MTAVQKCVVAFVAAATCLIVGMTLIGQSNADQTSDTFGLIGGLLFLATFPLALVGLFWLIRAATHPDA